MTENPIPSSAPPKPWYRQVMQDYCVHGSSADAHEILEFHIFNVIIVLAVAFILFNQEKLHQFYRPLARLVDLSIYLQLLMALLYYLGYPYTDSFGNCAEFIVGELSTIVINYAEFHQLYVIATILGLGKYNFYMFGSLTSMLNKLSLLVLVFSIGCFLFFASDTYLTRYSSMLEEIWTIINAALQIYCIRIAMSRFQQNEGDEENLPLISPLDSDVLIFEKLSIIQIISALFTLYHSISMIYFKESLGLITLLPNSSLYLILDSLCDLMFYLKVIIINERASRVNMEYNP